MQINKFNFKPGKSIANKYEIIEKIGAGWEGEVYKAKEVSTKIEFALKLFYPQRNKALKTSKNYAKKLYTLRDCNVVIPYHGHEIITYKDNKVVMLITEYVEGEILSTFIKTQPGKRLSPFQGIHLLHALASGVAEIHLNNEYHGDLHTNNIIIKKHGLSFDLKFFDFFHWDIPKRQNMRDDVCDLVKIFYDSLGGKKFYSKHPPVIKDICCGLKKGLILKKFRTAAELKLYLENLSWD